MSDFETRTFLFNRTPLLAGRSIEQPTADEVRRTPQLWHASLDDALRYGGDLARAAIAAARIQHDRRHIVVDSKVHMLMPGFYPSLPGWHNDGTPRGLELDPNGIGAPELLAQEIASGPGSRRRSTRFHSLFTGDGSATEFIVEPYSITLPKWRTPTLYDFIDRALEGEPGKPNPAGERWTMPTCKSVEFDWWALHRCRPSTVHEWRYFIRITETDWNEPERDLRRIFRTQAQVYVVVGAYSW